MGRGLTNLVFTQAERETMSKLQKYPTPSCALCGSTIRGKGYFCSQRCDDKEFTARAATSKAENDAGRPIRRAVPSY